MAGHRTISWYQSSIIIKLSWYLGKNNVARRNEWRNGGAPWRVPGGGVKTGTFAQHPYLASTWVWLNSVTQSHYKQIVFQLSYLAQLTLSCVSAAKYSRKLVETDLCSLCKSALTFNMHEFFAIKQVVAEHISH